MGTVLFCLIPLPLYQRAYRSAYNDLCPQGRIFWASSSAYQVPNDVVSQQMTDQLDSPPLQGLVKFSTFPYFIQPSKLTPVRTSLSFDLPILR